MSFVCHARRTLLTGAVLLALALPSPARADDSEESLRTATSALAALKVAVKHSRPGEVLLARLAKAEVALEALVAPPKPDLAPADEESKSRLKAWARAKQRFDARREQLLASWVKTLGKVLILEQCYPAAEVNGLEPVNERAFLLLLATKRPEVALELVDVLTQAYLHSPRIDCTGPLFLRLIDALRDPELARGPGPPAPTLRRQGRGLRLAGGHPGPGARGHDQ